MKYIIVTIEWMTQHGLIPLPTMRKSKDGSKVILHYEFVNGITNDLTGMDVYSSNSAEFMDLLQTEEWNPIEEVRSTDYIQVSSIKNLLTVTKANIQNMTLSDTEALSVQEFYPTWKAGISVKKGDKYNYNGSLWQVVQSHLTQIGYEPSQNTLAIWKKVDSGSHAGTLEDPIPYEQGMSLEKDRYYIQYDLIYVCIQSSGPLVYDLKDVPSLVTLIKS